MTVLVFKWYVLLSFAVMVGLFITMVWEDRVTKKYPEKYSYSKNFYQGRWLWALLAYAPVFNLITFWSWFFNKVQGK